MQQLQGWRNFYLRQPFGGYRADLRQLILIQYLMASQGGGSSDLPHPIYPYLDSDDDLAALLDYYLGLDEEEPDEENTDPKD